MIDTPRRDRAVLIAYAAALDALPPMVRVIFLLHRADGMSYPAIAASLSIDHSAVETAIAEALYRLRRTLDGYIAEQPMPPLLIEAEARLRGGYYRCCVSGRRKPFDDLLRDLGPTGDRADR